MTSRERAENWVFAVHSEEDDVTSLAAEFDAVRAEARREALEEAERACDTAITYDGFGPRRAIREAIRALKEKTP